MPSASSKSEKPASTETADPLKQAIVIIGHKIRNLEKRKSKLDSYKESINTLTKEQVEAVSKYDEVVQQLELSKEYVKQFTVISVESDKLKKKQAKKDAQEKYLAELNKVKQVLLIQDILQNMRTCSVREDFLKGKNGAIQLTEGDMKALDDLFAEVSSKRISEKGAFSQTDHFQKAAEFLMAIIEGKAKEVAGSTGSKLKELVTSIHTCGYFDQPPIVDSPNEESTVGQKSKTPENEEELHETQEILSNVIMPTQNCSEGNIPPAPSLLPGTPVLPSVIQPSLLQTSQPLMTSSVPNIVPTPVSQVESSFFNAQGFKPPVPPSIVPPAAQSAKQINDVIQSVSGKFNFLQESELEISEMNSLITPGNSSVNSQIPGGVPSTIPTRTFTNQNFNGQPGATPAYPTNYPSQQAAFQTFVPAFSAFVPSSASSVPNVNSNNSTGNQTTVVNVNTSGNTNIPNTNDSVINNNNSNNNNNIPNSIPVPPSRNPNVSFNPSHQQITSNFTTQTNNQNISQTPNQSGFQLSSLNVSSVENIKIEDAVQAESEIKEKSENEKQNWNQPESSNWADDWMETSEWNSTNQNHSEGRPNRNGGGTPKNSTSYQGNKNKTIRQGGYRDSSNNQGTINYYQNHNGYQSRNDRNNDFIVGGKTNSDLRDNTFKERGDFSSRERENYTGGFKRGPNIRGANMKGPMDRGDRQGQITRNTQGILRGPRNMTRQPGGRGGSSFQRHPTDTVGSSNK